MGGFNEGTEPRQEVTFHACLTPVDSFPGAIY